MDSRTRPIDLHSRKLAKCKNEVASQKDHECGEGLALGRRIRKYCHSKSTNFSMTGRGCEKESRACCPRDMVKADAAGNLYIGETGLRIRKVTASSGAAH